MNIDRDRKIIEFDKNIEKIEGIIGYVFRDKSLLRQAFTRSSFINEANLRARVPYQSNEVLEFFGDSVLSAAIVTLLIQKKSERYDRGIKTELDEGDFSNIRSKLSDKTNLSRSIERLGLSDMLILGEGDLKEGIAKKPSVKEDLAESIVGAVYIDSGFDLECVMAVVGKLIDVSVYLTSKSAPPRQSAKNTLQEWCADKKRRLPPPEYTRISESGPDHNKCYVVECTVDGKVLGRGSGGSVKAAESRAAEEALLSLGIK